MNDEAPHRRSRTLPILLALMVFAQFVIANEIRYQGCVANQFQAVQAAAALDDPREAPAFDCSRIPLI